MDHREAIEVAFQQSRSNLLQGRLVGLAIYDETISPREQQAIASIYCAVARRLAVEERVNFRIAAIEIVARISEHFLEDDRIQSDAVNTAKYIVGKLPDDENTRQLQWIFEFVRRSTIGTPLNVWSSLALGKGLKRVGSQCLREARQNPVSPATYAAIEGYCVAIDFFAQHLASPSQAMEALDNSVKFVVRDMKKINRALAACISGNIAKHLPRVLPVAKTALNMFLTLFDDILASSPNLETAREEIESLRAELFPTNQGLVAGLERRMDVLSAQKSSPWQPRKITFLLQQVRQSEASSLR